MRSGAPLSIYLELPPDKLERHASLLRLWIGTLIGVMMGRERCPRQSTPMLIDEAARLGELQQLRQAMTLLRGYGARVWSFWQDLSQLRHLYPNDWETILNNSRIQQYFGTMKESPEASFLEDLRERVGPPARVAPADWASRIGGCVVHRR